MRWVAIACAWIAAAAGCDSVFGLHQTRLADAMRAPDAPGCSGAMFGTPQPLPFPTASTLGIAVEVYPSLLRGDLELWLVGQPSGMHQIYRTTRAIAGDTFSTFTNTELDISADVSDPTFTSDELDVVFYNSARAWEATRATTTDPFGAPRQITELDGINLSQGHDLSVDGLTFYYTDSSFDLYQVTRPDRASLFDVNHAVKVASGASGVKDPGVSPDQLEVYYTARFGTAIQRQVRTDPTQMFSGVEELVVGAGVTPHVTADARTLVFSKASAGALMFATRACP
jgi:hypothetical protein